MYESIRDSGILMRKLSREEVFFLEGTEMEWGMQAEISPISQPQFPVKIYANPSFHRQSPAPHPYSSPV